MKRLIPGVFAAAAFFVCGAETPAPVKPFAAEAARIFPEAKEYAEQKPGIYLVRDGNQKTLGTLYLETIGDDERQFGYAGTIEIAVLFDNNRQVAGILIGRNQETPSFLNRVRAAKFLESWNKLQAGRDPRETGRYRNRGNLQQLRHPGRCAQAGRVLSQTGRNSAEAEAACRRRRGPDNCRAPKSRNHPA